MRLIDADALMNKLEREVEVADDWKTAHEIANVVKYFPTIEPQRMRGKWIEVDDAYNRISGRCSVCGWESHMYEDDVVGMNYCPNCGADMRGKE